MLFGGHSIHLICLPAEADLINQEGFKVRLPIRGRKDPVLLDSKKLPGKVTAGGVAGVNPADYDLIGLAMQEPQYRVDGVRQLLDAVGKSKVPCMSIMNMPPLAYLRRIPGLDCDKLKPAYTDASVWDSFDPERITLNSPDPQAIRPPEEKINFLQVTLPTNFKVARFKDDKLTAILSQLEKDVEAARFDTPEGKIELPVKLKVYDSVFVPLAKWAMLLAGNYRCVTEDGMRTAQEAVHTDIETSRSVYNFVHRPLRQARRRPGRPRAVREVRGRRAEPGAPGFGGARLEQRRALHRAGRQAGPARSPARKASAIPRSTAACALVDRRLEANRKKAAAAWSARTSTLSPPERDCARWTRVIPPENGVDPDDPQPGSRGQCLLDGGLQSAAVDAIRRAGTSRSWCAGIAPSPPASAAPRP